MIKKKTWLIVNPVAGGGKASRQERKVCSILGSRFGAAFAPMRTSGPEDAIRLAQEALRSGCELLIVMGGDGTINEAVNGLLREGAKEQPLCDLGVINCGSGKGFAQTLGLPESIEDQIGLILETQGKPVDAGLLSFQSEDGSEKTRFFVSECQAGLGGYVVSKVGMAQKRLGGTFAFGSIAVSSIFRYRATEMTTRIGGENPISEKLIGVTVGNGRFCAGGMQLTPGGKPDDGWLDFLRIREMPLTTRLVNFTKVYAGTHVLSPFFTLEKAKEIFIGSDEPVWVETDGELVGYTPCKIKIIPQAFRIRY